MDAAHTKVEALLLKLPGTNGICREANKARMVRSERRREGGWVGGEGKGGRKEGGRESKSLSSLVSGTCCSSLHLDTYDITHPPVLPSLPPLLHPIRILGVGGVGSGGEGVGEGEGVEGVAGATGGEWGGRAGKERKERRGGGRGVEFSL